MGDVLLLGEIQEGVLDDKTRELIGVGKRLAADLNVGISVVLAGDAVSKAADQAAAYGPDRVIKLEHPLLRGFTPELWLASLEQACKQIQPQVLLMVHGPVGMELGPRLAYRLNSQLTTDCIDLSVDETDGRLLRTKAVSGGNAISVFKCPGEPQMATLRGKIFEPVEAVAEKGKIEDLTPEIDESMIRVKSTEVVKEDVVSLDGARVVIAGGAGLGDEDGFELLEDLAKVLEKSFG
ncbi:MAG: FAD-binding protein, partial [Anaerolineales bacterium]